jgi:hypothetical protein
MAVDDYVKDRLKNEKLLIKIFDEPEMTSEEEEAFILEYTTWYNIENGNDI